MMTEDSVLDRLRQAAAEQSDEDVYATLCDIYPDLIPAFTQLASKQLLEGWNDEFIIQCFSKTLPEKSKRLWDEGDGLRARVFLRGIHHAVALLRTRQAEASLN